MSKQKKSEVKLSAREVQHQKLDSHIISPTQCKAMLKTLAKKNGGALPGEVMRKEERMIVGLTADPLNLHGVALRCFGIGFAYDRKGKSALQAAHEGAKVRAYDETLIPLLTSHGYTVKVTPGQEARFKLAAPVVKKAKRKAAVKKVVTAAK